MRRAVIFGAHGQLGTELQRTAPGDLRIVAHDLDVDIRVRSAVTAALEAAKPDVVFNCAAFTNVEGAESAEAEAHATNAVAPGILAEASRGCGARFVHVSTDYVFDGTSHLPYATDASPSPLGVYGATKLEGERRVLSADRDAAIVRTAWLHSAIGTNFVKTAARVLSSGAPMRVVDDQLGTPTRAKNLARALWSVAARPEAKGILHFTDAGVASWFDVAVAVAETMHAAGRLGAGATVEPISTHERPSLVRRPPYSVLDKHDSWRMLGFTPPHWRMGVVETTREILNA